MIEAVSLSKNFGPDEVLREVSFHIKKGEVVGFLGRNGAGKTTLMRILTTYLKPSAGYAVVAGINIKTDPLAVRRAIGYLPETPPLYDNMNVVDYLKFAACLKNVSAKHMARAIDEVLDQCHLTDVRTKTIGLLSKGYKQRVGIAQAIIHQPQVLILDEPTTGLDPIQIDQVRKLIKSLQERATVIISSHILTEIEELAERVLIIKEGALIADEAIDVLTSDKETGKRMSLEKLFLQYHDYHE